MCAKRIEDVPYRVAGSSAAGWCRVGTRVVYLVGLRGLWSANIAHTVDGFIVAIRHRHVWERQPKVYENLDEAMLIAEAIWALNQ